MNLSPTKKYVKNIDFCGIVMASEKDKIVEFNHYIKSDKIPYIIYTDIEDKMPYITYADNES